MLPKRAGRAGSLLFDRSSSARTAAGAARHARCGAPGTGVWRWAKRGRARAVKLRLLDPEVLVCVTILLSTRQSSSSASVQGRLPHPFWPTRWRVLAACLVALVGFCLPQEIPLEYWPLSDPSNGQLYLQFKARFEVDGAYYGSEDFARNGWWKPKTVTVTPDAVESPIGGRSADILQAGKGTYAILMAQGIPKSEGEEFTFSLHVKKQNHRYFALLLGEARRSVWPFFDLDTGRGTVPSDMPYRLESSPVGGGWWRLSISGKVPTNATGSSRWVGCVLVDSAGKTGRVLAGTEAVAVWGAQIEPGLDLLPYYPTGLVVPGGGGASFAFHPDFGCGFRPLDVIRIPISHTAQSLTYTLPLLDAPLCGLRVLPVDRPGTLWLEKVRLIDRTGRTVHAIVPGDYVPAGGGLVVEREAARLTCGPQPSPVLVRLPRILVPEGMNGRNLERCLGSWAYLTGMLTLILLCVAWLAARRLAWRQGLRLVAFILLLSGLFSAVAQRGLIRNSFFYAKTSAAVHSR